MRLGCRAAAWTCSICMIFATIAVPLQASGQDGQSTRLPAGDGQGYVQTLCTTCHGLETILAQRKSNEAWSATTYDMLDRISPGMNREAEIVAEYLGEHFSTPPESPATGGQNKGAKATSSITVGSPVGARGESVVVPVYLTPADGVRVGSLVVEISFVSMSVKLDKVERGIAAEMGNVELSSNSKVDEDEKGLEVSTVNLRFTSSASPPKALPAGLLAYVQMRIDEKGRPATISLRTKAEATELESHEKLASLEITEGKVEVVAPGEQPNIACFFFTH